MSEDSQVIAFEKQYVLKSLDSIPEPVSELTYGTLEDLGQDVFIQTFERCLVGISARDFKQGHPKRQFQDLISFAGKAFQPQNWLIAFQSKDIVGMVLSQAYENSPGEGSLFFIGVVPEFRGQGLGRSLHAKGLKVLSEMGLKQYIGSTDVRNKAMISVFKANACDFYKVRLFNQAGEPIGWQE